MPLSPATSWALLIGLVPIALAVTFLVIRTVDFVCDELDRRRPHRKA